MGSPGGRIDARTARKTHLYAVYTLSRLVDLPHAGSCTTGMVTALTETTSHRRRRESGEDTKLSPRVVLHALRFALCFRAHELRSTSAQRGGGGARGSEHKSGGLHDVEWNAEEQALLEVRGFSCDFHRRVRKSSVMLTGSSPPCSHHTGRDAEISVRKVQLGAEVHQDCRDTSRKGRPRRRSAHSVDEQERAGVEEAEGATNRSGVQPHSISEASNGHPYLTARRDAIAA